MNDVVAVVVAVVELDSNDIKMTQVVIKHVNYYKTFETKAIDFFKLTVYSFIHSIKILSFFTFYSVQCRYSLLQASWQWGPFRFILEQTHRFNILKKKGQYSMSRSVVTWL
jgi:hypothetical protein